MKRHIETNCVQGAYEPKNGEPRIVHIDNEFDNEITVVADNLEDLLTKIYFHEEI